jgi:hypothetical protein
MRNEYHKPELQVVIFTDVITSSVGGNPAPSGQGGEIEHED